MNGNMNTGIKREEHKTRTYGQFPLIAPSMRFPQRYENNYGPYSLKIEFSIRIYNHTNIGTVLKDTLGKFLRGGVERMWTFSSVCIPS